MNANEIKTIEMLNIILDNIEIAERNMFSDEAIKALYDAKDALNEELKSYTNKENEVKKSTNVETKYDIEILEDQLKEVSSNLKSAELSGHTGAIVKFMKDKQNIIDQIERLKFS